MNDKALGVSRTILLAAAGVLLAASAALADVYEEIVRYDWDQSRTPLAAIEEEIREAKTPQATAAIEAKLLEALQDPQATYACKQFVCRMLRRMGSKACVPALARLLADPKLSHMARFALQYLPAPEAGAALRQAMGTLTGKLKIGMITSVGERRDPQAVPALAQLAADSSPDLAAAAIHALGRIGTPEAAEALAAADVPAALKDRLADAHLLCADRMLADGKDAAAAAIYRKMFVPASAKMIRIAALRGIVLAEKEKAADALLALMKDEDTDLRLAATKFVIEMPGKAATEAFAGKLASLAAAEPRRAGTLLDALTARGDSAAAPQVTALLDSKDQTVRVAAIRSLGAIGDASSVPPLAKAATAGGAVAKAAIDSLNRLKGEGVGEAIGKLLSSPDADVRAAIIGVLTVRADKTMAPAMLKAARDKDENVRMAALKGLAMAGGQEELPDLVALLLAAKSDAERSAAEQALSASAARVDDADARTAPIVAGLGKADAPAKAAMISILARLGGAKALAAVRKHLEVSDAEAASEAVRALAAWPDDSPAADLLEIIKTTRDNACKILAFRGYIRMANMATGRTAAQTTKMYEQALALAGSATEKKSVLAGLASARSVDALRLVEKMTGDEALKAEAELALVQVAGNVRDVAPDEARAALKNILATAKDAGLRQKAQDILNEMDRYRGYITTWLGCGPYTKGSAFDTAYPPEKGDAGVQWKLITKGVGPQVIDLVEAIGGGDNRAAYAKTHVWSPKDQPVRLEVGSDDGVKVWINGKLAHSNNATRPCRPGEDKANAALRKGWNTVLVKIAQGGADWAFCLRVCMPDGAPLEGLKVNVEGK